LNIQYLEIIIIVAVLPIFLVSVKLAHGENLQGLLNDIENEKSYRQQLLDYILNSSNVNLTSPTASYNSAEENEKQMNQTVLWIKDLSIEELEQIVRNGRPYIVIGDHLKEKIANCKMVNLSSCYVP
jgi:hypothetical protein